MIRHAFSLRFAAFASLAGAMAQMVPVARAAQPTMVPIAGMAQQMVGREFNGVDCQTTAPTGVGTAGLWFPYIAGIPLEFLFKAGATVHNETTAVLTAVFDKVEPYATPNDQITNVSFKPHHLFYYYHPNTSPKDWTDFDAFQAGQLVGVISLQRIMFTVPPQGLSYGVNSGPLTYSADFTLPDGTVANLANFTPGGITVHFMATFGSFVQDPSNPGHPKIVDLTHSVGPVQLGSCAVMATFSGPGIHSASAAVSDRGGNAGGK